MKKKEFGETEIFKNASESDPGAEMTHFGSKRVAFSKSAQKTALE